MNTYKVIVNGIHIVEVEASTEFEARQVAAYMMEVHIDKCVVKWAL